MSTINPNFYMGSGYKPAQIIPNIDGGCQPVPQSPTEIESCLTTLRQRTQVLADRVNVLHRRLNQVLRPTPPSNPTSNENPISGPETPLGQEIELISHQLNNITKLVEDTLGLLEL